MFSIKNGSEISEGPYVLETFVVSLDESYLVIDL